MAECIASHPNDGVDVEFVATRFVLHEDLAVEWADSATVVVVNRRFAMRSRLTRSLFEFLDQFDRPRRLDEIASIEDIRRLRPIIEALVRRRLLVGADRMLLEARESIVVPSAFSFLNAPSCRDASATNFVVFGIPYDLADEGASRDAPEHIRRKSLNYPYLFDTKGIAPRGWFDACAERWVLCGATIADAGDIRVVAGESWAHIVSRIRDALDRWLPAQSVPVLLGGDCLATVGAAAHRARTEAPVVVRLTDSHRPDALEVEATELSDLGIDKFIAIPAIEDDVNYDDKWQDAAVTLEAVRKSGRPIHLSIDMAQPSQSARQSWRSSFAQRSASISALGKSNPIVGIDVIGLDTGHCRSRIDAICASQLALIAMSAAYDRA